MKEYLKLFGLEILYFILLDILAFILAYVQCIGKVLIGTNSGFLFKASLYEYNMVSYIVGLIVFVICVMGLFEFMQKKRIKLLAKTGIGTKLLWGVISLFFSACMVISIAFGMLCAIGFDSNIKPESAMGITFVGWPVLSFFYGVLMMCSIIKRMKREEGKEAS